MKLYIPEPEISDDEGFSHQADIFQRKPFGERLANLVRSCQDGIVIALDAQWGEGKSTFIKMWRGYISNENESPITNIYFDAFANDFQKDPFLALAGELYDLVRDESEEKQKEFKDKAKNVVMSLARGALKIGVRSVSGGVIDGSVLDGAEKDISTLLAEQVDIIISDKLKSAKIDRLAIEHFRKYLEAFAEKQGDGVPLVFIIDELDRCRPDFALDLLEQIKHLFSVPGIVFLLVLNRASLEESIKARYGNNIGATQYLQKFVNLWLTLPRKSDRHQDQGSRYIQYSIQQMLDEGEKYQNDYAKQFLGEVSRVNRLSCREIERILSYFALIENMGDAGSFYPAYQTILAFVCYLKVTKPILIEEILKGSIASDELIEASNLKTMPNESDYSHVEFLGRLIKFDLGDEETRQKMREEREYTSDEFGHVSTDMLKTVCEWISNISRQ